MPNSHFPRYYRDGKDLEQELKNRGISTTLRYGEDIPAVEREIIEQMIDEDVRVLVISPVIASELSQTLTKAKAKGITVISYDTLINNTENVDYFVTFNYFDIGIIQGKYIADKLELDNKDNKQFNVELFSGPNNDPAARALFDGAMFILGPYFRRGKLFSPSGRIDKTTTSIEHWSENAVYAKMTDLIEKNNYGVNKKRLDAVLSPSDILSNGISDAIKINTAYKRKNFPVITGMDCSKNSIKKIRNNFQSMCVIRDSRILSFAVSDMIESIIHEEDVPVNDTSSFDNGQKIVPTFICSPKIITKENMKESLLDSGYYDRKIFK